MAAEGAAPGASRRFRAASAYTLGNVIQRGLAFVMLPFFTRAVTPAQYGQLSVAFAITGIVAVLMTFGFDLAIYRTFFQLADDPPMQRRYVQSAWVFLIAAPAAMTTVVSVGGLLFLPGSGLVTPLVLFLAVAGAATSVSATRVPFGVLRAEERLGAFMAVSAGSAVSTSVASVLAVIVLHTGVIGWLTAVVAANLVELVLACWLVPFRPRLGFDRSLLSDSFRLGLPLVPHYLSQWALQVADRLLLAGLVSKTLLGVYSLGANVAVPFMILVTSVGQSFMPTYARAGKNSDDLRDLNPTILLQSSVVVVLTLAGALLAPPLLSVLTPHKYAGAMAVAPWIVLGYGFLGLYYVPIGLATLAAGKTKRIWLITVAASAVNLGLIRWLVPHHGIIAAAVASAAGYAVLLAGVCAYAARVARGLHVPWASLAAVCSVCAAVYALAVASTSANLAGGVARVGWLALGIMLVGVFIAPARVKRWVSAALPRVTGG